MFYDQEQKALLKEEAIKWIERKQKCLFIHGYHFKGGEYRVLSNKEAKNLLEEYEFGLGLKEMTWRFIEGEQVLVFNEYDKDDIK